MVDNVAAEAVLPQEVSGVQHHSMRVLSRDSSDLSGLAIHDRALGSPVGVLMARSSLLVARMVQVQVQSGFPAQVARMEEALGSVEALAP